MARYGRRADARTLCLLGRGTDEYLYGELAEAFPSSVFWFMGCPRSDRVQVSLDRINSYLRSCERFRFLLLEFASCSELLPFMSSLTALFQAHNFEEIFLVSHSSCAAGTCLLPSILEALASPKYPFNSLTIWGNHLSNQVLRVTVTVTYACSYIEMHRAPHHPPLQDLSFFKAISALHFKLYPRSAYLSGLSICDFHLQSLDLISVNFTDCGAIPDAIYAWLTSNVVKAINLQSIVLSNNGIDDTGALKLITALRLRENSMLRILDLSHNSIQSDGFIQLASALSVNTTLSHLYVGGNPTFCQPWDTLITVLSTTNKTIQKLQVDGRPSREASVQVLCDLIKSTTTLQHLEICAKNSCLQSDVAAIFKALEQNQSLTSFALPGCLAVDGDEVYEAILDAIVGNDYLENLDLKGTPIDQNPKQRSTILRMLGLQHRHTDNKNHSGLRHLPKVQPSTSRLFVCGEGLAAGSFAHSRFIGLKFVFIGKTTFCRTMTRVLKSWHERYLKSGSKTKLSGQGRTKGIQVTHLECDKISLSLWDLAGQREYHAFHDLMFPLELGPSLFLIVCSLTTSNGQDCKPAVDLKHEVEYWLCYISSNTRKLRNKIPNVILIFSHKDKLPADTRIVDQIRELASQWRTDYKDFTRVLDDIFIINSHSKKDVKDVAQYVFKVSVNLLAQCPPIYDLCNKARHWIDRWNYEHPDEPWIKASEFLLLAAKEFGELIQTLPEPVSKRGLKELMGAVCFSLHDSGHVIFFKEVNMVVLNPGWFCEKVMGGIIDRATKALGSLEQLDEGDAWNRKDVEQMLEEAWKSGDSDSFYFLGALRKKKSKEMFSVSDLVQILVRLDFCYELIPGKPGSKLFIPSALQHNDRDVPMKWVSTMTGPCIYVGRRLKCEDEKHTFLTPGFFPALQVHLRKSLTPTALYSVVRNVIRIHVDRMEILIELCEKPITFIDILAHSSRSSSQTILFIREHIIESIQRLQGVTGHWQGIDLVEGIVRPVCVERLTPCTERLHQFVLVDDLRRILLNTPPTDIENVTFPWPESRGLNAGVEHSSIKELLGEEVFSQVLAKVLTQITHATKELNLSVTSINSPHKTLIHAWKRSSSELNNSVEKHVYSLAADVRNMMHEIKVDVKDMKTAVGDLVKQGQVLAPQIESKISELLMGSRAAKLPRLFVLMKGEKLITRFTPGLKSVNLQFMCEHEGGLHVPSNQPGCDITIIENDSLARIVPYLKYLLSAICLGLKVGAHVVGGISDLVPDLSSSMDEVIQGTGLAADAVLSVKSADAVLKSVASGEPLIDTNSKFLIARAWVEEVLEKKGCVSPFQIIKTFGLGKAPLADGRILWLCEQHMDESCVQVDFRR